MGLIYPRHPGLPSALLVWAILAMGQPARGGIADGKGAIDAPARDFVEANTRFGLRLLGRIDSSPEKPNVVISPSTLMTTMALMRLGASGRTLEQIDRAMTDGLLPIEEYRAMRSKVRGQGPCPDPAVTTREASSLWAGRGCRFSPAFVRAGKELGPVDLKQVDFADPQTGTLISRWVGDVTGAKASEASGHRVTTEAAFVLASAAAFKGLWTHRFDAKATHDGSFTVTPGKTKNVPMMERRGTHRYLAAKSFEAVALPYGAGRVCLYVFLPRPGQGPGGVVSELAGSAWTRGQTLFRETEGTVGLPRFRASWNGEVGPAFDALGMKDAFDPKAARFPGILGDQAAKPYLHHVEHGAMIEVDEQGTAAAASTTAEFRLESVRRTFELMVARPFVALVRDERTGDILFAAQIIDPGER